MMTVTVMIKMLMEKQTKVIMYLGIQNLSKMNNKMLTIIKKDQQTIIQNIW